MRTREVFTGGFLKAEDLGAASPVVTIDHYKVDKVGDDRKPILFFVGKDRPLVLNVTNANRITEIMGTDEMDDWVGKQIRLYVTKVDYQGQRVPAIRVESPKGQAAPPPPPPDDDDVPF
jgi:hypothetical protein